jgi:hypothetical protein
MEQFYASKMKHYQEGMVLPFLFAKKRQKDVSDTFNLHHSIVYYESRKRELKIRLMNEGWCDERLKGRVEESTHHDLTYTG